MSTQGCPAILSTHQCRIEPVFVRCLPALLFLYALVFLFLFPADVIAAPVAKEAPATIPYSQYHQRIWDTRNNMPQVSAISIAEDNTGFIWVATEGGLARFDGNRFRIFDGRTSPLFSDPILRKVFVTPDDRLFVGTSNHLLKIKDGQIEEVLLDGKSLGAINDIIWFNGYLYAAGEGLFRVSANGDHVNRIAGEAGHIRTLATDQHRLWIGSSTGLSYLDGQHISQSVPASGLPSGAHIIHLAQYREQLLVGTSEGLFIASDSGKLRAYETTSGVINDPIEMLFADSKGNLWIGGKQRLLQLTGHTLVEEVNEIKGRTSPWFVSAFEDRAGNLWFGSRTHGLQRLRYDGTASLGKKAGLDEPYVWTFGKQRDGILAGTNAGLYLLKNHQFTPLIQDARLPNHVVYSILTATDNTLWLGTRSGLVHLDENYQVLQRFPQLDGMQINGIEEFPGGDVLVASTGGLFRWDQETLQKVSLSDGEEIGNTRFVFADNTGDIWAGTTGGLIHLNGKGELMPVNDDILNTVSIAYIGQLKDGRMLVGTFQSGFAVQQQSGWYWPDERQLPASGVMFMAEQDDNLVISSLKGVYQISKHSLEAGAPVEVSMLVDDYGPESDTDGIRCCNGAGDAKGLVDGNILYLPTLNGVATIDLTLSAINRRGLVPVVDEIIVQGESVTKSGALLPEGERNLQINYTSPRFYRNSALEFRYRLNGYDRDWINAGNRREAFYTNLPPGDYTFEVEARLKEWNAWGEPAFFRFSMPPFWYEQQWMRLVFVLLAVLAFWAVYHIRTRRLERARLQLEAMVTARTAELDKANKQLAEANEQLQQASLTDSLTRLNNRRYLDTFIDKILAKAARQQRGVFCIILDIDNFKVLNDELGHAVGDDILVKFADILRREVRSADHVIRWGGEEFLIVLDAGISVSEFIGRLMCSMELTRWPHQQRLSSPPTCSVGVCYHPPGGEAGWTWSHTLILADKAMYMVKRCGKEGWLQLQPQQPVAEDLPEKVIKQKPEMLVNSNRFHMEGSPHILAAVSNLKNNIFPLRERK